MRALLLGLAALALAAPAGAQQMRRPNAPRTPYSNPTAGIAADVALSQLTGGKKGRWYALRETAAPDAVMFVPEMALAEPWLKARRDVLPGYKLRPLRAWASCDGTLVVTSGAWQDGNARGWYTNVWQRQPDGAYRWVFNHAGPSTKSLDDVDMIEAKVADCPPRKTDAQGAPPPFAQSKLAKPVPQVFNPSRREGKSRDGSLMWHVTVDAGGAHRFIAGMLVNGQMEPFRDEKVTVGGL